MRFAFVVAHPTDAGKFVAAECGPRELSATIMAGVSEFFSSHRADGPKGEVSQLIAQVNELNRAITGASIAQDWVKARKLMNDLAVAVDRLGSLGRAGVEPKLSNL